MLKSGDKLYCKKDYYSGFTRYFTKGNIYILNCKLDLMENVFAVGDYDGHELLFTITDDSKYYLYTYFKTNIELRVDKLKKLYYV